MVKSPRSQGCRVCVQRRIKCDLARPFCSNCDKARRLCTGYSQHLQFRDEGSRLRSQYQSKSKSLQHMSSDSSTSISAISQEVVLPINAGQVKPRNAAASYQHASDSLGRALLLTVISPSLYQAQLLSQLITSVSPANEPTVTLSSHTWNTWLAQLATFQATTPILDYAVRALVLSHLGRSYHDQNILYQSHEQYAVALAGLSQILQHRARGLSDEALSITVLLSFYEIINGTAELSWVRHAGGAAQLLQLRGAEAHRRGLGRITLLAYRPFLISEATSARKPCFLDSPEWRSVLNDTGEQPQSSPFHRAIERMHQELARLPGYLHAVQVEYISFSPSNLTRAISKGQLLRETLKCVYQQVASALQSYNMAPSLVPSPTEDDIFPFTYVYPNTHVGSIFLVHWITMICLNRTLQALLSMRCNFSKSTACRLGLDTTQHIDNFPPPERYRHLDFSECGQHNEHSSGLTSPSQLQKTYEDENVENARKCCMSAENFATGVFLSPTFLIFALRTALVVLDSNEEKKWISSKLDQIGQTVGIARFRRIGVIRPSI